MAVPTPSNGGSGAETASLTRIATVPASAVLAAAIPFLFFHIDFQPGFTVDVGSLSAHAVLSDFAVLAVAVVAAVAGLRHGFAPLRAGWPIWLAGGLFVLLVGAANFAVGYSREAQTFDRDGLVAAIVELQRRALEL